MNIYTITVLLFSKRLESLKGILTKAQAHAAAQGIDEKVLLQDALAPDMFPFKRQVQVACDQAKGAVARLVGVEAPKFEDTEETFAELQARIDKTLAYLHSVQEDAFADSASRKINLPYFPGKYLDATDFVLEYALPNFFFHLTTAYAIARRNNVPLGKADFMSGLSLKDL